MPEPRLILSSWQSPLAWNANSTADKCSKDSSELSPCWVSARKYEPTSMVITPVFVCPKKLLRETNDIQENYANSGDWDSWCEKALEWTCIASISTPRSSSQRVLASTTNSCGHYSVDLAVCGSWYALMFVTSLVSRAYVAVEAPILSQGLRARTLDNLIATE